MGVTWGVTFRQSGLGGRSRKGSAKYVFTVYFNDIFNISQHKNTTLFLIRQRYDRLAVRPSVLFFSTFDYEKSTLFWAVLNVSGGLH